MGDVIKSISGTYYHLPTPSANPHSHLPESSIASTILELRANVRIIWLYNGWIHPECPDVSERKLNKRRRSGDRATHRAPLL